MILVFVGAGGSAAVDREQYPTTARFFEKLPGSIKKNSLFKRVTEFIENTKKDGESIDIEEVLWNLSEIQEYSRVPNNPETPVGWVMEKDFFRKFFGFNEAPTLLDGLSRLEENHITPLISEINVQVYERYATLPSGTEKVSAWIQLFKGLAQIDPIIEIFTTNYDRVLEYVIEQAEINVETGQHPRFDQRELNWIRWDALDMDFPGECGLLTKLHGSVNWHREDKSIVIGPSRFTGSHNNHVILYPGNKGKPTEEPFQTFHKHLQAVVQRAKMALFIGFSFRDEYINTILSDLPQKTPKFVITKSAGKQIDNTPPTGAPLTGNCLHWRGGFTEETAEDCLGEISAATGRPLDS